jgi:anti-anti-sigma regulatory factor
MAGPGKKKSPARKALERFRIEIVWKRAPAGKGKKSPALGSSLKMVIIAVEGLVLQDHATLMQKCFDAALVVPFQKLLLDLSGVPVISQRGIKALLRLHYKLKKQGRALEIHGLQPAVHQTLVDLGLNKIFLL